MENSIEGLSLIQLTGLLIIKSGTVYYDDLHKTVKKYNEYKKYVEIGAFMASHWKFKSFKESAQEGTMCVFDALNQKDKNMLSDDESDSYNICLEIFKKL